mmetsp:Transcript_6421/g.13162  ORF Transcript_6421/g.13162 Transcript_6421/m.13162 type:complete len:508 (-) Transcript_6421:112-1635(-)
MPPLAKKRSAMHRQGQQALAPPRAKRRKTIAGCEVASPEDVGLRREPLDRLRSVVHEEVHTVGSLNGAAHLIIKDGKCIFSHSDGMANIERGTKFGLRTICALHSCSKPLTVAAFLTLVDEGKVRLSDPINKYLNFSKLVASGDGNTRKAKVQPTLRHLLAQVAGLRHSDSPAYAQVVEKLKRHEITDLAGFCDALMEVPLQSEPGALHYYSLCIDVLGRVCEVVSGKPLDVFMTQKLFEPLQMVDTHFKVPAAKLRRKAALYDCKRLPRQNRKTNGDMPYRANLWTSHQMDLGVFSGGGGILSYADAGIYSTAEDYARFCLMLLHGGLATDGRRILREKTVNMLWKDGLTPFAMRNGGVPGWNDFEGKAERPYWDHHAWSLLNATLDLEEKPKKTGPPRQGNTLWMYGMGAYWFLDAKRKIVAVSMAQCFSSRWKDRGTDCVPFLKAAIDEGDEDPACAKSKREKYYGKMAAAEAVREHEAEREAARAEREAAMAEREALTSPGAC